jgi:hypothetical protein
MSLIVDKAHEVQSRLSNHGIGFYTSGQLFLEEYYVLAMVGKAGLNTLHMYDTRSLQCNGALEKLTVLAGTVIRVYALQRPQLACVNLLVVTANRDLTAT